MVSIKRRNKIKESFGERMYTAVVYLLLASFCMLIIIPLLHIISGSFSDPMALLKGEVSLLPKGFTLEMYEKVFNDDSIWQGYWNTIVYTVVGTCISVVLTACAAYPLSRKDFFGRNVFTGLFVFTMFFTGGMIPTYLLVKDLGMLNTMWALVLPSAVSTYNMIIMRTFFQTTIPTELEESASLDGCNDLGIFFRIVIPLALNLDANVALCVAAVLSAGVFGSHVCFYSDATVISSAACGCDNFRHSITQAPYGLLGAAVSAALFLICGFVFG